MKYLFVLGRDEDLSIKELEAYFDKFEIIDKGKGIVLAECPKVKSIEKLGGVVKIAEVLTQAVDLDEVEYALDHDVIFNKSSNKPWYSVQSFESKYSGFVIKYLKMWFKDNKFKAQYRKELSPTQLSKCLNDGVEFILFRDYVAKTKFVSDPLQLVQRDDKRPYTNPVEDTSLRFAKILINLSGVKKGVLLDPYCRLGSILQEGLLMGYSVIGISREKKNVMKNLDWLNSKFKVGKYNVLGKYHPRKVDLVVTEPYMGPYLKKLPIFEEAKKISKDLRNHYYDILDQISKSLKVKGKAVIVVPKIRVYPNKEVGFNFEAMCFKAGFTIINGPIDYFTLRAKVRRRIYVIQKV